MTSHKMLVVLFLYLGHAVAQRIMMPVATIAQLDWQPVVLGDAKRTPVSASLYYQNVTRVRAYNSTTDRAGVPVLRMEVSAREADRLHGAMVARLPRMPPLRDTCLSRNIQIVYEVEIKVETETRRSGFAPGLTCNMLLGSDISTSFNMSGLAFMFGAGGNNTNVTNPEIEPFFPIALMAPVSMTQTCDTTPKSVCPQSPTTSLPAMRYVRFKAYTEASIRRNDSTMRPYDFRVVNDTELLAQFSNGKLDTNYPGFNFKYTGAAWIGLNQSAPGPNLFFSSLFTNLTIYNITISFDDGGCKASTSTQTLGTNATSNSETTLLATTAMQVQNDTSTTSLVPETTSVMTTDMLSTSLADTSAAEESAKDINDDTLFGLAAAGSVACVLLCCACGICFMRHYGPRSPRLLRLYSQTPFKSVLCICCRGPMEADDMVFQRTGSEMDLGTVEAPTSTESETIVERARRLRGAANKSTPPNLEYGKLPPPDANSSAAVVDGYTSIPLNEASAGAAKGPRREPTTTRASSRQHKRNNNALAASLARHSGLPGAPPSARHYDIVQPVRPLGHVEDVADVPSEADDSPRKNIYDSPMSKLD